MPLAEAPIGPGSGAGRLPRADQGVDRRLDADRASADLGFRHVPALRSKVSANRHSKIEKGPPAEDSAGAPMKVREEAGHPSRDGAGGRRIDPRIGVRIGTTNKKRGPASGDRATSAPRAGGDLATSTAPAGAVAGPGWRAVAGISKDRSSDARPLRDGRDGSRVGNQIDRAGILTDVGRLERGHTTDEATTSGVRLSNGGRRPSTAGTTRPARKPARASRTGRSVLPMGAHRKAGAQGRTGGRSRAPRPIDTHLRCRQGAISGRVRHRPI